MAQDLEKEQELNDKGLLPPGIHCCTVRKIETRYALANHRPKRQELTVIDTHLASAT
jgi:hypothetical protein